MPTPLDVFMETLHKRDMLEDHLKRKNFAHTSEENTAPRAEMKCEFTLPERPSHHPISSLSAHTHTSDGFLRTEAEMECETKCEQSFTLPQPPLRPGWLVVYQDSHGRLRGGCDERDAGTVLACRWNGQSWVVQLTCGEALPISMVRAVSQTDANGNVTAAWTVREHGVDGAKER
jgi:hypothetical protein